MKYDCKINIYNITLYKKYTFKNSKKNIYTFFIS